MTAFEPIVNVPEVFLNEDFIGVWDNVTKELMNDYKVEDNDIKIIKQRIYERRFNKQD